MALSYNTEDKTISVRRGDGGMLVFKFKQEVSGLKATFAVKKHISDFEDEAVIVKTYIMGSDPAIDKNTACISITGYDTDALRICPAKKGDDFQDYYWMLSVSDDEKTMTDTVVPSDFDKFPIFRVYYGSVD